MGMDTLAVPEAVGRLSAQATRRTTPCGAGEMVWRVWGATRPGVRPLVLLHGGSGSWTHWVRNIDALVAAGQHLWVPDLPGFGESALPPSGSDADALIEPLHSGLQQLLPGQPCDLVGFSFGGMTAGMLLAAYPALAARLVLVGAPAMGVVPERQFDLKAWRHLPTLAQQLEVHRYNLAALMLHDPDLIEGLALQLHVANMQRDRMPRRRLSHTDILARSLAQVACPVHAIYGQHDALYKSWIDQLQDAYARAAPDFRGMALVDGAGHWVQFERPQAFHTALLAALAG
ncbi:MAG: alpha/beta hydrolase [Simplicispira sp.]|nr:alpha/beta hydrolase [Simplicispira sp.]